MRAERLLRRLPRPTFFSALELALLALIAVQAARLVWALVTPLGPVGEWRPASTMNALPAAGALGDFDPFFRLQGGGGPAVVTGLNLQLFGVREDRATGRGSAIVGLPDGTQRSFGVGEEIIPGVTLAAVGFDNVTINRAGAMEQIFLDQSQPAQAAGTAQPGQPPAPAQAAPPPPPIVATPAPPANAPLSLQPRVNNNQITGLIVAPGGDGGAAYRAAGFQPGDVIVAVNGQRVTGADQALTLFRQAGGSVTLMVDRGGRAVPVRMRTNP